MLDISLLKKNTIERNYFKSQINLIKHSKVDSIFQLKKTKNNREIVLSNILIGDFNLYKKFPEDSLAFLHYRKSFDHSLKIKDTILITESLKKILNLLTQKRKSHDLSEFYLDKYKKYLYDLNEKTSYLFFKHINIASKNKEDQIAPLKSIIPFIKETNNNFLEAKCNQMIGVYFSYFKKENDSALYYMQKARKLLETKNYQYFKNELFGIYGNIGQYQQNKGQYLLALNYYNEADKIKIPKYRYLVKVKLNEILSENANSRNQKDSAYYYLKRSNLFKDTLNEYNKNRALIDLDKKYKTKEKEIENLQLKQENLTSEAKRKQNQNLFYGSLAILFFGGIIYYQNIKNSKRKRLFAEQQKELEKQKNITLLKEQEITTINAIVNGQEKERIRIAEDLHDNIGSVLATLKLHFENLKLNREKKHFNQEALYLKTEKLIDETYFKVRNLAHAKNAGVIANKGLLTAVKIMAEKISDANKISIEVLDFGLEKRLENNLELTIFRIIQELTTNIIKHAEATNATINLSLYDNNLNIIIEDNGKGFTFNTSKLQNDGMGLGSIKTRVKHLKGTFEVDSTLGKGASILINVPV